MSLLTMDTAVPFGNARAGRSQIACVFALIFLIGALESRAGVIPPDRLPPGGMFQAGVPGGIPQDYTEFCDVTVKIPGSALLAAADGVTDDSAAINAALSLCPARQYVYMPAGTYRIAKTIKFPCRGVVLRGSGSQMDPAHTNIKCDTVGTAVNMSGGTRFGAWLANLKGGYTAGSTSLTFSSPSDIAKVTVGDMLLVGEGSDPSIGVSVGGGLESVNLPSSSYSWHASPTVPGAFYLESAAGGTPNLVQANIREMFYSPGAGTESILQPASSFALSAGQWTFGDNDSLGFNTIYVMLPGDANPATLPPPSDGVPNGGVWYNKGIDWAGTYLGGGGIYAHHGQGFKVVSIDGASVTLDRPFYWTFCGNMTTAVLYIPNGTGQGLENLSIQIMQASPMADAVSVNSTMNSWVKNVEVKNSAQNFIVATNTIDCEFRENYVHEPFNAKGGSGYGIRLMGWNFNNLVEDNIAYFCRHSYVVDGINTGHVIAYNFSLDPNDNANGTLVTSLANPVPNDGYLYQDFLTHGSNPRFCLFEGNVGGRGYCDYVHGSANNLVYFRNHFRLQEGHILSYKDFEGSETIDFDRWNYNMTVVGNILGYPTMQADQLAAGGKMVYESHFRAIYRLGYNDDDSAGVVSDNRPKATMLRHGNFDYFNNAIIWDPTIPDRTLPDSLYLTGTPSWFGNMAWPPVDPTHPPLSEGSITSPGTSLYPIIPAMYRFLNGAPPPVAAKPVVANPPTQPVAVVTPVESVPNIATQPTGGTIAYCAEMTLSVVASARPAPTYQWQLDGVNIVGATSPTYVTSMPGTYTVVVTNSAGTVTSSAAVVAATTRLANFSNRALVGTNANVEIEGFVISGPTGSTEQVLVRGAGPALSQFGVSGFLAQPVLTLFDSTGKQLATNTAWNTAPNVSSIAAAFTTTGAFAFPLGSADSALLVSLPPGAYTAQISGLNGTSGVALAEVYEVKSGNPALINISARAFVSTGTSVEIGGFVVTGSKSAKVLVRAIGPTLSQFGVSEVLAQPSLSIIDSSGKTVASNTGWSTNANPTTIASEMAAVGAFALPSASADCALLLILSPGAYTAVVSGVGSTSGVAVVEVYQAP